MDWCSSRTSPYGTYALSCEFSSGCPQELLYSDDLVLIAESMEELIEEKEDMETKGLGINTKETKQMAGDCDTGSVRSSVCQCFL